MPLPHRQIQSFARHLAEASGADVRTDDATRDRYSTDQSIYRVCPLAVCIATTAEQAARAIAVCAAEGVPVTPRGRGSGTAGAALGAGVVLLSADSGGLAGVSDVYTADGDTVVRVGPGVVHAALQGFLGERGLYLPADPTSAAISVLGGNIATKASGPHALRHGSIDRHLRSLSFIDSRGELIDSATPSSTPSSLLNGLEAVRRAVRADHEASELLTRRLSMKCASGLNLGAFVRKLTPAEALGQLLVGSIGTLGFVTSAELRVIPIVPERASTLLYFTDLRDAGAAVVAIRDIGAAAIEIVNHTTLSIVKKRSAGLNVPDTPCHVLLVEYEGPARMEQIAAVERLVASFGLAAPAVTVDGPEEQQQLWKVRKALLPLIRNAAPGLTAPSVVNDIGIPPERLAECITALERLFARLGLEAAIYGHAGSGNLHLRPFFPRGEALPSLLQETADAVYELVLGFGGTVTAEHGMGRLRAPYLRREWGDAVYGYMQEVKQLFDPTDVLNPGVLFGRDSLLDDIDPRLLRP
ncbi:MAG: FAD-binding protein [Chitinivibrionales bacterium]|nr:FAD-binding protein [Chitinivibrionales bacterium]